MIFFVLENIHGVSKYLVVHASHKIVSHNLILITHSVANYSFFILCGKPQGGKPKPNFLCNFATVFMNYNAYFCGYIEKNVYSGFLLACSP